MQDFALQSPRSLYLWPFELFETSASVSRQPSEQLASFSFQEPFRDRVVLGLTNTTSRDCPGLLPPVAAVGRIRLTLSSIGVDRLIFQSRETNAPEAGEYLYTI